MGGRTVVGRKHRQHCEFPFIACNCTMTNDEICMRIQRKLDEIKKLIAILEENENDTSKPHPKP